MDAATTAKSSYENFKQLVHQYPDIEQLIAKNADLQTQIDTLDAQCEKQKQVFLLHRSLDTLNALAVWVLRSKGADELARNVKNAAAIIDVAVHDLNETVKGIAMEDPLQGSGTCNPACVEPAPYCCDNACRNYLC